ncbi:MAG: DUF5522 domain-containing protein [Planctomycetota bacterium]
MSHPEHPLVEGVDYHVEDGRWVFSAHYHLKRGYCCSSGCRHCPYGNSPADRDRTANDGAGPSGDSGRPR